MCHHFKKLYMDIVIKLIPVFVIVVILQFCANRFKKTTKEQYTVDGENKIAVKAISVCSLFTFFICWFALVFNSHLFYILGACLPTIALALILAFLYRPKKKINVSLVVTMSIIISITVIVLSLIPIYMSRKQTSIDIDSHSISISGIFGDVVDRSSIKSITLVNDIPDIDYRVNGYSFGDDNLGKFKTDDGKIVMLYTHSQNAPFIKITRLHALDIYINTSDPDQTFSLFHEMTNSHK